MTTTPYEMRFRRILLPLDSGATDSADLDAAVRLAARFHAEVVGIFIEDEDLMRLAALPFARETAPLSASTRRLDPADMARALRARRHAACAPAGARDAGQCLLVLLYRAA